MKQIQNFNKMISSTKKSRTSLGNRLAALTRLSRDQINSVAQLAPWFIWEEKSAVSA